MGGAQLASGAAKHLVHRSTPSETADSSSLSSRHTAAAVGFTTAVSLCSRHWGAIAAVLAALTAVGRVHSAAHYPTDVGAAPPSAWLPARSPTTFTAATASHRTIPPPLKRVRRDFVRLLPRVPQRVRLQQDVYWPARRTERRRLRSGRPLATISSRLLPDRPNPADEHQVRDRTPDGRP
jgi:hypothetical protein